jgi:phosphoribosylanthranilate isomerase
MFGKDLAAPGRVRVKICGVTTLADALIAIHAGADALGFNFFRGSRRYVNPRHESDWMSSLPNEIMKVAVMVDPTWSDLTKAAHLPFIDAIQLHGNEPVEFCRRVAENGILFAKALPVSRSEELENRADFFTNTVILDSSTARGFGGSGETFDWTLGRRFVEKNPRLQVIIAGGLTPENVAEAVRTIRPFGVDVTTGVESSAGRKDPARVQAFIAAARSLE